YANAPQSRCSPGRCCFECVASAARGDLGLRVDTRRIARARKGAFERAAIAPPGAGNLGAARVAVGREVPLERGNERAARIAAGLYPAVQGSFAADLPIEVRVDHRSIVAGLAVLATTEAVAVRLAVRPHAHGGD